MSNFLNGRLTLNTHLHWRTLLLGSLLCIVAAASMPYASLKLGMGVDLGFAGMFLAAALLGRRLRGSALANELNVIQAMIGAVGGVGFMCVILAAFFYIQVVFERDIGFNLAWWQIALWVLVSANLGIFMGAIPRRMILNDKTLPWPTGEAVRSVAETLSDPRATDDVRKRRKVLTVTTMVAGFFSFLKDGLHVVTPMVGNARVGMMFSPELLAIGIGMLVPLSVGLSGLLGVWILSAFGETVAPLGALMGTAPEYLTACRDLLGQGKTGDFLARHCGDANKFLEAQAGGGSYFQYVVKWMMWPATAMMVGSALTGVLVPLLRNAWNKFWDDGEDASGVKEPENEHIPTSWIVLGVTLCVLLLTWLQSAWFDMSWKQVLVAVAIQPILIIAGLRILAITGQGPVSLMANATQFVFGLLWPAHILQNLAAAHTAADPQASAEGTVGSFWVARKLKGSFKALVIAQLIALPIGAFILPIIFNILERTYGIGLEPGQLAAPTGLKIAALAMVMESGLSSLPPGAMAASIVAVLVGIAFEALLFIPATGKEGSRFWWIPIPAALGFALILPPILTIATAVGSVIAAVWKAFSKRSTDTGAGTSKGTYEQFAHPIAAGLIAGEIIVASLLLPVLFIFVEYFPLLLDFITMHLKMLF